MNSKELMELHDNVWRSIAELKNEDITPYIKKFKMLDKLTPVGTSFFIIVNLSTYKYEFLGSNQSVVTGFDNELVKTKGIKFLTDRIHPEDGEYVLKKGYSKFAEILQQAEVDQKSVLMQSNYRLMHKDGHFVHLVEQNQLMDMKGVQNKNFVLTYICEVPAIEPFRGNIVIKKLSGENHVQEILYKNSYPDAMPHSGLSERELDVVRLLAEGRTSNQIAEKLFISPHTVRTHRRNILDKLGLNTANEMVAYVVTRGLL